MQVFDLTEMKNMFHLRWKPSGVLSGVWFGIKIYPPDPNGHHLLASGFMNNFIIHPILKLIKSWVLFSWWLNNLICHI